MDVGETHEIGALRIEATFAAHDGARPPYPARAPALGYAVHGTQSVYFAGDTDLFDGMTGLVPGLDLALLPIWGWGPSLGRGAHLDPQTAADALALLRPRIAVPIHWGTYAPLHRGLRTAPAFLADPREAFVRAAADRAPGVEVPRARPGRAARAAVGVALGSPLSSRGQALSRCAFAAVYSSSVRRSSARSRARRSSSSTSVGPAGAFGLGHGIAGRVPGDAGPSAACSARA